MRNLGEVKWDFYFSINVWYTVIFIIFNSQNVLMLYEKIKEIVGYDQGRNYQLSFLRWGEASQVVAYNSTEFR